MENHTDAKGINMTNPDKSTTPEFKKTLGDLYDSGWNAALEMAAFRVEHEFIKAFGKDTLSSMAIYIRSLKK
jgi:hypothetical protein